MLERIVSIVFFLLLLLNPSVAQDLIKAKELGTFEDWIAYTFIDANGKVCVMSSTPLDMEPKNVKRGDVEIQIVHDNRNKTRDVVNVIAGYPFAEENIVIAEVDTSEFKMFTKDDAAWNYTEEQDKQMIQAMISGSRLTITGKSSRGTTTRDIYSLLGFTAAYKAIDEACGE